ncbi:DUF192 domain-containing protein [Salibacterium halotolerans]|uniref:DUF192 domain-containing protein n=1 Tax=Salibacterium halotolerans TaxID=1884432 RepID=UPI000B88D236
MITILTNHTKKKTFPVTVHCSVTTKQRVTGLMFKKSFEQSALVIPDCRQIHTFFMRFCIDVLFIDSNNYIVHIEKSVKPWRISPKVTTASYVLESASGTGVTSDFNVGDQVEILE